jgi:hypothetical protein
MFPKTIYCVPSFLFHPDARNTLLHQEPNYHLTEKIIISGKNDRYPVLNLEQKGKKNIIFAPHISYVIRTEKHKYK